MTKTIIAERRPPSVHFPYDYVCVLMRAKLGSTIALRTPPSITSSPFSSLIMQMQPTTSPPVHLLPSSLEVTQTRSVVVAARVIDRLQPWFRWPLCGATFATKTHYSCLPFRSRTSFNPDRIAYNRGNKATDESSIWSSQRTARCLIALSDRDDWLPLESDELN